MTLPIITATFGEISLFAPIANVLLISFFELFLYVAPFSILFAKVMFISNITDLLYNGIMRFVDFLCAPDTLLISLKPPFVFYTSIIICVATVLLLILPLKKRAFVFIPSGVGVLIMAIGISVFMHQHFSITEITYFKENINEGFVITDQNESLYIDVSNGASSPAYTANYIAKEQYSPKLSGVLFTHCHSKHVSTLRKLANSVKVNAIYLPQTQNAETENHAYSLQELAESMDIDVHYFAYGTPFSFASSTITVFEPVYLSRSTHPVISLELHAKETDILYLGSSFNETKQEYANCINRAEYIFFGQHHPKAKKAYDFEFEAIPIYCSEEQYLLSQNKILGVTLKSEADQYEIILKNP